MSGLAALEADRRAEALAGELRRQGAEGRALALVLGSGLGEVVEHLEDRSVIPMHELEHAARPQVTGHAGQFVLGTLGGVPAIVQSGRVHLYEGRSAFDVTRNVRAFAHLGVTTLVLTNASGGLVAGWEPGTLMRITDHLNLQGKSPLYPSEDLRVCPYDVDLGRALEQAAAETRVTLERGVYAGMLGPSYETPAEVRALIQLGAHAVGMSTVAEACAARAAGVGVAAVACIANPAAGLADGALRHEDVLAVMRRCANRLGLLLARAAPRLAAHGGPSRKPGAPQDRQ